MVANITKWWDGPQQRSRPNAYVIDVYNQGMSGENRLTAMQKTALIGATLLIEFAYYIPEGRYFPEPKPTEPELTEPERPEPERPETELTEPKRPEPELTEPERPEPERTVATTGVAASCQWPVATSQRVTFITKPYNQYNCLLKIVSEIYK